MICQHRGQPMAKRRRTDFAVGSAGTGSRNMNPPGTLPSQPESVTLTERKSAPRQTAVTVAGALVTEPPATASKFRQRRARWFSHRSEREPMTTTTQNPAAEWGQSASNHLLQLMGTLEPGSRWHAQLSDLAEALAWSADTLSLGEEPASPAPDGARAVR